MSTASAQLPATAKRSGLRSLIRWWLLTVTAAVVPFALLAGSGVARATEPAEPPVGPPGPAGDYLRKVHERLHGHWADGFIRMSPYKVVGPANSTRQVDIALTVRWDGTLASVTIINASDAREFDSAALNAIAMAAPLPPPVEVMADDGLAHLRWRFARDHRLCSGGEVVPVEFPLEVALPRLAARGRLSEALRRMREGLERQGWSGGDFLAPFARQWLARPQVTSELDILAVAALAVGGERGLERRLESALFVPETALIAAGALTRMGREVAPLLEARLAAESTESVRSSVVQVALADPKIAVACGACADALVALVVKERHRPAALRARAVAAIARLERTEAISEALKVAAQDANPAVQGPALLATVTKERPSLIKMASLLRNRSPELRAAGAAGVIRAGGEEGVEQLYRLPRETDVRPIVAAAAELGQLRGEDSATLLEKLLKRTEPEVRLAVIQALAARRDAASRKLAETAIASAKGNPADDASLRKLALDQAAPAELVAMAADTRLGLAAYRALLRANLREDAARWILFRLEELSPEDQIAALGDWIARVPDLRTAARTR